MQIYPYCFTLYFVKLLSFAVDVQNTENVLVSLYGQGDILKQICSIWNILQRVIPHNIPN